MSIAFKNLVLSLNFLCDDITVLKYLTATFPSALLWFKRLIVSVYAYVSQMQMLPLFSKHLPHAWAYCLFPCRVDSLEEKGPGSHLKVIIEKCHHSTKLENFIIPWEPITHVYATSHWLLWILRLLINGSPRSSELPESWPVLASC